jgi:hypothetical protein
MENRMSDYTTKDAVQFAVDGEATKFQAAVNDVLMSKVSDALEVERINMAQAMFAQPEEEVESEAEPEEEISDEDV